ncbi:hypothetical protein CBP31_05800 [Oceanisphaera profunda]|uniref:SsuA/THI5-like domain-containing protein n=1 Tax=Oceanisphaera profunda TaxID=1416627 RepID=A0A1Y0D3U6_9GAMM|nr:ABC transporter substrate-binding protein [Oceanisphaera profunda]ART82200.1 hypothetical protein CBP31_05800 [Oceanisphaera profunda]
MLLSLTLTACDESSRSAKQPGLTTIRIASWSLPITEQINLLAEDKDFFSPHQVAIKFIPGAGGSDAINKIIAGEADIAFADPGALFSGLARGEKLVALYDIYPQNVFNVVSLTSSNIRSPKDLKGKKIGVYSDTSGTKRNLLAVLRQARLRASDVEIIETGVLNFDPLIHGQVDATSATDTALVAAQANGLGEVNVIQVKDYFNYSSDLFVVTEATYAQKKEQLHAFLAGYKTSVRWMIENVDEAAQQAVKYAVDGKNIAHNATIITLRNTSSLPLSGELSELGLIDFNNLQDAANMYYEMGLISRPLDLRPVVDSQYRLPLWSGNNSSMLTR